MRQRWWDSNRGRRMDKQAGKSSSRSRFILLIFMSCLLWCLLLFFHFSVLSGSPRETGSEPPPKKLAMVKHETPTLNPPPPPPPPRAFVKAMKTAENKSDPCGGRYVYVHDLPAKFNDDMLKECRRLSLWTNMCKFTANSGLGPPLDNSEGVFSNTGWFATNQFSMDVIFSNRMKQYECLTNDSSLAAAIYVPFYAGLDISRHLWGYNISVRDSASLALMDWLMSRPEWKVMNGHDHFLVGGRITWDFRRLSEQESDWGSKLLFLPAMKNMTMLVVEASPWNKNDMAIPYPTYFHPAKDSDISDWQKRMKSLNRPYLFSFAGAPRPGIPTSIRGQIMDQCKNSKMAKLLECDLGESKCHSPSAIMKMFQESVFCLQPQGDSYTRRSLFDSMLAGCIPVLFHPGSAYAQYIWHLPKNYTTYSVFIAEDDIRKRNASIEEVLLQIPEKRVKKMRENVIKLIPNLVYADPRSKLGGFKDAFDVAVQSMIGKIAKLRMDLLEGRYIVDYEDDGEGSEQSTRKWEGLRRDGERTWDEFFSKPKPEGSGTSQTNDSWRQGSVGDNKGNDQAQKRLRL
uniref:TSA: Wollemia nobilis Ref_Wollemi_Transcript_1805_2205 transcribed RNA sequence n=1 Tax=Wollemia nobilis TaxID=56998 RepID=A0A0C9RQL0_9CONI